MSNSGLVYWFSFAARGVLALVVLIVVGLFASPLLMRRPRARPAVRSFGCFLYAAGLWILVRCLVGGLGALLGIAVYLWEKGQDIERVRKSVDELQAHMGIGFLLMFIVAIGLLDLFGERLRRLSEKHRDLARAGFRWLFRSQVASELPQLMNSAEAVLAYRAVWEECFSVPAATSIEGWKLKDLRERLLLIYFSPSIRVIQPSSEHAGATITVSGAGFTGARSATFGSVTAEDMSVVSDTEIRVTVPPGRGTVSVSVISQAGVPSSASPASRFVYL